jgi:hypothetical protein
MGGLWLSVAMVLAKSSNDSLIQRGSPMSLSSLNPLKTYFFPSFLIANMHENGTAL